MYFGGYNIFIFLFPYFPEKSRGQVLDGVRNRDGPDPFLYHLLLQPDRRLLVGQLYW